MNLRDGDALVSMDVLPVELADQVVASAEDEEDAASEGPGCLWYRLQVCARAGDAIPLAEMGRWPGGQ